MKQQLKKVRDRVELELTSKLEERDLAYAEALRQAREAYEREKQMALSEAEAKISRQFEWQMREIREE